MNKITLGGKMVYEPPDGAPLCNFFEETAGASRYGYGLFCMLASDYQTLLSSSSKVQRLVMTTFHKGIESKLERDVVMGRARFCSASAIDVSQTTYTSTFVNVLVYDLTYLLSTADKVGNYNVINTTASDITAVTDKFFPSTLSSGTTEYSWAQVFSDLNFTAPPGGYPSYTPRNLIFDYLPRNRIADRIAAANAWIVGRIRSSPDTFTNVAALAGTLRFYNPGETYALNETLADGIQDYLLETTPQIASDVAAHLPTTIRCLFSTYNGAATDPYAHHAYSKDITVGGTSGNVFLLNIGEYPAFWDETGGTYVNQAELDAVAAALAPYVFDSLSREVNGGIVTVYAGLHDFCIDGSILSIRWESNKEGARTIVSRDKIRTFSPLDELYGSIDSIANQSVAYMGLGNTGLSVSGVKYIWGYGGGGEEQAVITQIRQNGLNFEYKSRVAKCQWAGAEDADWTVWVEGTVCATTPAASADILNWMGM